MQPDLDRDAIIQTLQHALEALAWHDGLRFEMDGWRVGCRIERQLADLGAPIPNEADAA